MREVRVKLLSSPIPHRNALINIAVKDVNGFHAKNKIMSS